MEKKAHTIKSTVISDSERYVHFLGATTMGSTHDFRLFQLDFDPEQRWRFPVQVLGDLAYTALSKHFEMP